MESKFINQRVLVRSIEAGVYYGTLVRKEGAEVELANARNLWRWRGANTLLQLANEGVKNPDDSDFSDYVESLELTNVCQIVPCTEAAITNIESVEIWKR